MENTLFKGCPSKRVSLFNGAGLKVALGFFNERLLILLILSQIISGSAKERSKHDFNCN